MDAVGLCGSRLPHRWEHRMRPLPPSTSRGRRAPCGGITQRPCPRPCRALGLCPHVSGRKSSVSATSEMAILLLTEGHPCPRPHLALGRTPSPRNEDPASLTAQVSSVCSGGGGGKSRRGSEGLRGAQWRRFPPIRLLAAAFLVYARKRERRSSCRTRLVPTGTFPTRRLLLRLGSVSSPGIPSFPASSLGERSR